MYFRTAYNIQDFAIKKKRETFHLSENNVKVTILRQNRKKDNEEEHIGEAIAEIEVNGKNLAILTKILNKESLSFSERTNGYSEVIARDGNVYRMPDIKGFPVQFQEFYSQVQSLLLDAIKRVVNNTMWVYNRTGPHSPFTSRADFGFSFDGKVWHHMPSGLNFGMSIMPSPISISSKGRRMIESSKTLEPSHHSLFREAWNLKEGNKRSAFVISLAALESSIKHLITRVSPTSEWLIENVPSPNVNLMLREMLFTLPIKNKIDGEILRPNDKFLNDLKKWVLIRNKVIHRGTPLPKSFDLKEILSTLKSIMYLMDYYSGEKWAILYVEKGNLTGNK